MVRWNLRARYARAGALLAAVAVCATAPAAAEVRVSDAGGGRLVIEAHDATVQQILEAVAESRPVRFKASEALSRHVTGTYTGTLPRVLSRVLDGYDHVIRSTSDGIRIDVVGGVQTAKFTASVANSVTVSAVTRTWRGVSSNVDQDEENAQPKSAPGPHVVNLAAGPHPSPPPVHPPRPATAVNAQHSGAPRVTGNVDLDEETSQ